MNYKVVTNQVTTTSLAAVDLYLHYLGKMIMVLDESTDNKLVNHDAASCLFAASRPFHDAAKDNAASFNLNEAAEMDAASQLNLDAAKDAASLNFNEAAETKNAASQPSLDAALDAASLEQDNDAASLVIAASTTTMQPKAATPRTDDAASCLLTVQHKAAIPWTDDAASCLPNRNAAVSWMDAATPSQPSLDAALDAASLEQKP